MDENEDWVGGWVGNEDGDQDEDWRPPAASLLSPFKLLHWHTSLQVCNVLLKIDQSLKQTNTSISSDCEMFLGVNFVESINPGLYQTPPANHTVAASKLVLKQNAKIYWGPITQQNADVFLPNFSKSDTPAGYSIEGSQKLNLVREEKKKLYNVSRQSFWLSYIISVTL